MHLETFIKDNSILIIPNNLKNKTIKYLNSLDKLYNVKILTFDEIKKKLLFDYNNQTIHYVMKKQSVNYNNAKELINNMYYLFDEAYSNNKISDLYKLKVELDKNNLLIKDLYFAEGLKNKEIIVYGFDYINKFNQLLINILKNVTVVTTIEKTKFDYKHPIYSFKNLNAEIEFIANDIINKKLDLNHVFIFNLNNDNESTIKRIFNNYHLNINLKSDTSLYETKIGNDFLNNLENYKKYIDTISNESIKNSIINIINKYYWIDNKLEVKDMIIEEFKQTRISSVKYQNAVNEIDIFDNFINDDDFVYLIDFNGDYIPIIYKDIDYISDNEKFEYLETSVEKNIIEKEKWKNILQNIKNLTITSCKQNLNGSLKACPLIVDLNLEVIPMEYQASPYSNQSNRFNLGLLLDEYQKYGTRNSELNKLISTYQDHGYNTYDNSYYKVDIPDLKYNLSYSKMNTFFECPFRYYCDNILKLSKYEETFDTWTGSLCHYILSKIYNAEYDYGIAKEEFISNNPYNLTYENKVFLDKILTELKGAIKYIKSLSNISKYQNVECEKYIETSINNVNFNGIIDKVMKYENNIVLIDYKTGNPNIDLRLANYGLNLQLPTYIFLIKQVYPDSNIVGIYLEHILKPNINKEFGKSEREIYENHLKLAGYSLGDETYLKDFDPTYENSEYIKSLKMNSNGFSSDSKLLTKDNFQKLEKLTKNKIEECIQEINNTNFKIEPKMVGKDNISCKYCPYKSICFTNEKEQKYLDLDRDLTFLGGDDND